MNSDQEFKIRLILLDYKQLTGQDVNEIIETLKDILEPNRIVES